MHISRLFKRNMRAMFAICCKVVVFAVIFLISLELLLCLAGVGVRLWHDGKNRRALQAKGSMRILCLGGSTTFDSYPAELKQLLDERYGDDVFSVIDMGRPAMNSTVIRENFAADVKRFDPDLVICMMGINDFNSFDATAQSMMVGGVKWLSWSRAYRLVRLLCSGVFAARNDGGRKTELNLRLIGQSMEQLREELNIANTGFKYVADKNSARSLPQDRVEEVDYQLCGDAYRDIAMLEEVVKQHPYCLGAFVDLIGLYEQRRNIEKIHNVYNVLIERFPASLSNMDMHRVLFEVSLSGRTDTAVKLIRHLLAFDPGNWRLYNLWADFLIRSHQFESGLRILKEVLLSNPETPEFYYTLATACLAAGKEKQAVYWLKTGIDICGDDPSGYGTQMAFLLVQLIKPLGKRMDFEQLLEHLDEKYPMGFNASYWGARAVDKLEKGDMEQAGKLFEKAASKASVLINPVTRENYLYMCRYALERDIVFVAMQYPLRSVRPLEKMLAPVAPFILFLDNSAVFRRAVADKGFGHYFTDQFGGDFGHVTDEGKKLLAGNIVEFLDSVLAFSNA